MKEVTIYGFGFNPLETKHHFLLKIPKGNKKIKVYERFVWDEKDQINDMEKSNLKIELNRTKWNAIKDIFLKEFNRRLKKQGLPACNYSERLIPFGRLYGKELVLLLWAIEDAEISLYDIAKKNWLGLSPEERWWLFTTTNAASGSYNQTRGWRIALRYAFTENPTEDMYKNRYIRTIQ